MSVAVLSLGSNLGDRLAHLRAAAAAFGAWSPTLSPVYETAPWGPVPQQDYLNAVLIARDEHASPRTWLERARAAEAAAGRRRDVRWGPRTLDVDVVSVDDTRSDDPELILPHPRAAERAFVLVPWLALDPAAVLGGQRVAVLVAGLDTAGVRLRGELELS